MESLPHSSRQSIDEIQKALEVDEPGAAFLGEVDGNALGKDWRLALIGLSGDAEVVERPALHPGVELGAVRAGHSHPNGHVSGLMPRFAMVFLDIHEMHRIPIGVWILEIHPNTKSV